MKALVAALRTIRDVGPTGSSRACASAAQSCIAQVAWTPDLANAYPIRVTRVKTAGSQARQASTAASNPAASGAQASSQQTTRSLSGRSHLAAHPFAPFLANVPEALLGLDERTKQYRAPVQQWETVVENRAFQRYFRRLNIDTAWLTDSTDSQEADQPAAGRGRKRRRPPRRVSNSSAASSSSDGPQQQQQQLSSVGTHTLQHGVLVGGAADLHTHQVQTAICHSAAETASASACAWHTPACTCSACSGHRMTAPASQPVQHATSGHPHTSHSIHEDRCSDASMGLCEGSRQQGSVPAFHEHASGHTMHDHVSVPTLHELQYFAESWSNWDGRREDTAYSVSEDASVTELSEMSEDEEVTDEWDGDDDLSETARVFVQNGATFSTPPARGALVFGYWRKCPYG